MKLSLDDIDALVFDFDGVLTDNTVFLNEDGKEWVRCNRGDGLAFSELEKLGVKFMYFQYFDVCFTDFRDFTDFPDFHDYVIFRFYDFVISRLCAIS